MNERLFRAKMTSRGRNLSPRSERKSRGSWRRPVGRKDTHIIGHRPNTSLSSTLYPGHLARKHAHRVTGTRYCWHALRNEIYYDISAAASQRLTNCFFATMHDSVRGHWSRGGSGLADLFYCTMDTIVSKLKGTGNTAKEQDGGYKSLTF